MSTIDRTAVTSQIAERVRSIAADRGVSDETLTAALALPAHEVEQIIAGRPERILAGQEEMTVADGSRLAAVLGVDFGALLTDVRICENKEASL